MGELSEEHRREMAQDAEGAGFGFHARFAGVPVDHFARNEVENLLENDHIGAGWCFVVHITLPSGRDFNLTPARFLLSIMNSCGMAVVRNLHWEAALLQKSVQFWLIIPNQLGLNCLPRGLLRNSPSTNMSGPSPYRLIPSFM